MHVRRNRTNDPCDITTGLIRYFEGHWGLQPGTLTQGHVIHVESGDNRAVLTQRGGAVGCGDKALASVIADVAGEWEPGRDHSLLLERMEYSVRQSSRDASCSLDIGLWHCGNAMEEETPACSMHVEPADPKEVFPSNGEPGSGPTFEHLFAVREGDLMVSRAFDRKSGCIDGVWLHAVGVGTHPDYQGRGLAKAVVSAIVKQIIAEDGIPLWNCDATNLASLRVARSTGFKEFMLIFSWR